MTGTDPSRGLPDELRELGRGLPVPPVDGESMAERVLARLIAESVPAPVPEARPGRARRLLERARRRRRSLGVVLSGALVALVLTPPVRAAVVDWFGFGGVEVRYTPSAPPPPGAGVPACGAPLPLGEAGRRAGFAPPVPRSLGEPDAVSLTAVPGGRFAIALCWYEPTGTVRLDAFPARLDLGFSKQVRVLPEWLELSGGRTALWFEEPHVLRFPLTDGTGRQWTEARRTAGPTLLWTSADGLTTLRLEGVAERELGRAVAESLR
ncbi:hypothetical protein RB196_04320 [Streptomyces sp. PmtA]|uniref:hypothetical protein n=1 Tax=Streptomyces sp. PmtA TaxID=3074275 RepID=UPI0030145E49